MYFFRRLGLKGKEGETSKLSETEKSESRIAEIIEKDVKRVDAENQIKDN